MSKVLLQNKLDESGITLKDAKNFQLEYLTKLQTKKLVNYEVPAIKINYFNLEGKKVNFYRLRYLEIPTNFGKPIGKYTQPKGSGNFLYFPPSIDWTVVAKDAEIPVYITEGEFKAIAASKLSLATIGLPGVSSWKNKKTYKPVLDEFNLIDWHKRHVYLVFDSDLSSNPQVQNALISLAKELSDVGAIPYIIYLPVMPETGLEKTGLDDYLKARGYQNFLKLTTTAEPFNLTSELWALNEEVVYIKDPGVIVVRDTNQKISPNGFKEHAYANRHYYILSEDKMLKKKAAPAWLEWPQRTELTKFTYSPGEPKITADKCYNLWEGWGVEPVKGDIKPWKELLDALFKDAPKERAWFEKWCAIQFQKPGIKLYTAVLIWGIHQGTGKSLIGYTLQKIFGDNGIEIQQVHLHGDRNDWAENKQFVMGDEITGSDKRVDADKLKNLITQKQMRINAKYVPAYNIPDCINYYFTSQHPDAFFLEDHDRRFFIHEVRNGPLPDSFYAKYDEWLHGTGPSHLFYHLIHNVDTKGFNPTARALITESKQDMIYIGKSDLGEWVYRLKIMPDEVLQLNGTKIKGDLWTTQQLLQLYDPDQKTRVTSNGMGRELRRAGFRVLGVFNTVTGSKRLYAIRRPEYWNSTDHKDIVDHYNSQNNREQNKRY
jgi:hypothetical protein